MNDDRDDAALLEAHVAGDPGAFGLLFGRHRDRLWAVALRTTGNPEDAADALQDALVSAFRRAGSFRGDSAVTTWLHRIVVNACLDRLRRAKVRRADPLPDDLEERAARGAVVTVADPGGDPEARALAGERRERVRAALNCLPAEQRAALVLVDLEGYPVVEAASMLEVPPGTVKSRCARGRARLATLLSDLGPLGAGPQHDTQKDPHHDPPPDPGVVSSSGRARAHPGRQGTDPPVAASHSGDPSAVGRAAERTEAGAAGPSRRRDGTRPAPTGGGEETGPVGGERA